MKRTRTDLRALPQVESVLQHAALAETLASQPRSLVVEAVRAEISDARQRLRAHDAAGVDAATLAARAALRVARTTRPGLRRVLNATGIVLHTNLGRAPLAEPARRAVQAVAAGYASLEYDLDSGRRGDRGAGIERWVTRLTGAEAASVVNNGAAAILVTLSAMAAGRGVVVSRGELVEIGGSFRVPEIMEKSGARLVEVGATNRTHLRDYARALERHGDIAAILRVHPSNFRMSGFTRRPELAELAALARRARLPLIEDLGSGAIVDFAAFGLEHEPTVAESIAAGADVVTFSGDKLLGASQAGFIAGRRKWVDRIRKDSFARAMRLDKLSLAALEATLPLYADPATAAAHIPALAMLRIGPEALAAAAARLAEAIGAAIPLATPRIVSGHGEVGGGALPDVRLAGPVVEIEWPGRTAQELERLARAADPPVIGLVRAGRFRLDPRTLLPGEIGMAVSALAAAWAPGAEA